MKTEPEQTFAEQRYRLDQIFRRMNSDQEKFSLDDIWQILRAFDGLVGRVILLRTRRSRLEEHSDGDELAKHEELLSLMATELSFSNPLQKNESVLKSWILGYRSIWRRDLDLFLYTLVVFVISVCIGWTIGHRMPTFAPLLIPQNIMENVVSQEAWFHSIQQSPLWSGIGIAVNNIKVALSCFLLGSIFGLGGLFILAYNGIFLGTVVGYCRAYGFEGQLIRFISGHGPLELTIIIASAYASLLYGRVFFMRPRKLFFIRIRRAFREALIVVCGIVPWLLLAACIEAFVSPFDYLDFYSKVIIGALAAISFWLWTFWPSEAGSPA